MKISKKDYNKNKSWGMSLSIDLHKCNPEIIRNADKIKKFVYELCDLIGVKRFGECTVVNFGAKEEVKGFSMTQLIETSLISGHFANMTNTVYLDVFSCAYYDPKKVTFFSKKFFQAKNLNFHVILRK
jgi:S-adenosylmethionine decarboxylase